MLGVQKRAHGAHMAVGFAVPVLVMLAAAAKWA
jgi:hypothetical protein